MCLIECSYPKHVHQEDMDNYIIGVRESPNRIFGPWARWTRPNDTDIKLIQILKTNNSTTDNDVNPLMYQRRNGTKIRYIHPLFGYDMKYWIHPHNSISRCTWRLDTSKFICLSSENTHSTSYAPSYKPMVTSNSPGQGGHFLATWNAVL